MINPKMPYRSLGSSGTKVSLLGLGGWTTFGASIKDPQKAQKIIQKAYEAGINFFDIADVYANGRAELQMGKILKKFPRHHLVISSKVFFPMSDEINDCGLSRKHIMESVEKSLKRIGTDYIDIYFCHKFDDSTPLEETIRTMDDLIHQGKILYWGTSSWTATQLTKAFKICEKGGFYKPQVEQPCYNLLMRDDFEKKLRPLIQKKGMGVVTFSPLASGLLSGKHGKGIQKGSRLARIEWLQNHIYKKEYLTRTHRFIQTANKWGLEPSQLAIAWVTLQKSISSVILGVSRLEQLINNLKALDIKMTSAMWKKLNI